MELLGWLVVVRPLRDYRQTTHILTHDRC